MMPYAYLDHEADMGIQGSGDSLAEAFAEGARAMFGIMADLEAVQSRESITVHCEAPDAEALFVDFLNELLFQREVHGLLLSRCEVQALGQGPQGWAIDAVAWGEPPDLDRHEILTEVKAATYSGLKVFRENAHYVVQCVVDI
jgi:SHS2 domain-containing protein